MRMDEVYLSRPGPGKAEGSTTEVILQPGPYSIPVFVSRAWCLLFSGVQGAAVFMLES